MKRFLMHVPFIGFLLCVIILAAIMLNRFMYRDYHVPQLPPIATDSFDYQDILENAPIVLNIFASWCGPCRSEHDELLVLKEHNIPVYGIVWNDTPAKINAFLAKAGDPYTQIGYDTNNSAIVPLGVKGLPETFIVGKDGHILHHHRGPLNDHYVHNVIVPVFKPK